MHKIILLLISLFVVSGDLLAAKSTRLTNENVVSMQKFNELNNDYTFEEVSRVTLPNGEVRIKLQQMYKGVPVMDGAIIVAEEDSKKVLKD